MKWRTSASHIQNDDHSAKSRLTVKNIKNKQMKKYILITSVLVILGVSCGKNFLSQTPQGQLITEQITNTTGVENLLIGAYGILNGNINGTWGNYAAAPSNWLLGEVGADDAHKGSNAADQGYMNDIFKHTVTSLNDQTPNIWTVYYEGVIRCNSTLATLKQVQEGSGEKFSDARAKEIEGEAKMLRAHYYFILWRVFKNIPYVDESITTTADAAKVKNDVDVMPKIQADLEDAVADLDNTNSTGQVGRMNKVIAQSYLGKLFLYQKKYDSALALFKTVISAKPDLVGMPFEDNFSIATKNNDEAIMQVQDVINPDGSGDNANVGDMLGGLYGTAPVNCCGFNQPSIDLVNSFKVDANGLPYLDDSYRNNPYTSDMLLTGSAKTNYKVDQTLAFDPRLDYTVGRRGVWFKDWGVMPGDDWIREVASAGPFVNKKDKINSTEFAAHSVPGTIEITDMNINIIRLADVYLMAAECAVETNDLAYALKLVNEVRERAAKLKPIIAANGAPAAAYNVKPYPSFPNADYARSAVRFERRLELAEEGSRFFDLVRWGIAKQTIESYSAFEGKFIPDAAGITFETGKDEIFPIPQQEIDRSNGALTQN